MCLGKVAGAAAWARGHEATSSYLGSSDMAWRSPPLPLCHHSTGLSSTGKPPPSFLCSALTICASLEVNRPHEATMALSQLPGVENWLECSKNVWQVPQFLGGVTGTVSREAHSLGRSLSSAFCCAYNNSSTSSSLK